MSRPRRTQTVDLEAEHLSERARDAHAAPGAETAVQLRRVPGSEPTPTVRRDSLWARTFGVRRLLADVIAIGVIALMAFAIWPVRLGGATSYIIIKGTSMEPKFHTGDLAVLRTEGAYHRGDIVAYKIPRGNAGAGHLVIHRIIGRSHGGFLMQGDNRTTPDTWYPKPSEILGKFRVLVPLPGITFWALLPWVCCGLIGGAVIWICWPRESEEDPADAQARSEANPVADDSDPLRGAVSPVVVGARRLRRLEQEALHASDRSRFTNRRHAICALLSATTLVITALSVVAIVS